MANLHARLAQDGIAWWRQAFNAARRQTFIDIVGGTALDGAQRAGIRLQSPSSWREAEGLLTATVTPQVEQLLDAPARLLRMILFSKTSSWSVPWHRDLMIPVVAHHPSQRLTAPSIKDGIPHVRATRDILEQMLTVRIHLDDASADDGPLQVIPGSHHDMDILVQERRQRECTVCLASAGDVLFMRPLILHHSARPKSPANRRVLHIEYTSDMALPDGFKWWQPPPASDADRQYA